MTDAEGKTIFIGDKIVVKYCGLRRAKVLGFTSKMVEFMFIEVGSGVSVVRKLAPSNVFVI